MEGIASCGIVCLYHCEQQLVLHLQKIVKPYKVSMIIKHRHNLGEIFHTLPNANSNVSEKMTFEAGH